MKSILATLGAAAVVSFSALPASGGTLTFSLDYVFSGSDPAEPAPWLEATFEDVDEGVRLTISANNLTDGEFISAFYFNLDPILLDPGSFVWTVPDGLPPGEQTGVISAGNNAFQADGDGLFDFRIQFPTANNQDRFINEETFVAMISGSITTADFDFMSVNGPADKNGFYAAAHVQGIVNDQTVSAWIAPSPVPEPGTLLLLGAGLTGVAACRRRGRTP